MMEGIEYTPKERLQVVALGMAIGLGAAGYGWCVVMIAWASSL